MSLPIIKLEDHIAGDTWQGIPVIGPFTINGAPPENPASRIRMRLLSVRTIGGSFMDFDSAAGEGVHPIVIVDAANWEFSLPPVAYTDFSLPPGQYEGQLEITDDQNIRITTHELRLTIKPDK